MTVLTVTKYDKASRFIMEVMVNGKTYSGSAPRGNDQAEEIAFVRMAARLSQDFAIRMTVSGESRMPEYETITIED